MGISFSRSLPASPVPPSVPAPFLPSLRQSLSKMIASTFTLAALAGFSAVQAIPLPQLATVEASLSTPNTTQDASVTPYEMNGNAGACGWYNKNEDVVVGLPNEFYEDLSSVSAYCGKFVVVTDPRDDNTVTALVADASTGNKTLSVSQGTWTALNGTDSDLEYVNWRFANETETADAKAALKEGSSSSSAPSSTSYAAPSSSSAAEQQQEEASSTKEAAPSSTQKATTSAKATTTTQAYKAPSTTSYAPKTTTTTTQAPKTTQAQATKQVQQAASSSNTGSYSGKATFYSQGGAAGSCGNYASDSDYVVAVNAAQMNSGWCGRTVNIKNTANGKTISAKVADTCPGCSYGSLDLSMGAFGAIGNYDTGVLSISWGFA